VRHRPIEMTRGPIFVLLQIHQRRTVLAVHTSPIPATSNLKSLPAHEQRCTTSESPPTVAAFPSLLRPPPSPLPPIRPTNAPILDQAILSLLYAIMWFRWWCPQRQRLIYLVLRSSCAPRCFVFPRPPALYALLYADRTRCPQYIICATTIEATGLW
jgi:hypothetical protein